MCVGVYVSVRYMSYDGDCVYVYVSCHAIVSALLIVIVYVIV